MIKSIDRLGRNYKEILKEWQELTHDLNVDIVVLDMPLLNTATYKGLVGTLVSDIVLQILSFVAEQERDNIKQRQREGIKIAKEKGTRFGRPEIERPKNFEDEYLKWKKGEQTAKVTMEKLGLKRGKFYMFVKKFEKTNNLYKGN